tara:strand:+ start:182 stop:613 length:432 start_codon:yes stop_codon:yes gene_type:complete
VGRKRAFTLIEIVISVSIISFVGVIVLVKTKPLLNYYRSKRHFEKLVKELVLTKHISNVAEIDIDVELSQTPKGVVFLRRTDEPLNLKNIFDCPLVIPNLELIHAGQITIVFSSRDILCHKKKILLKCFGYKKALKLNPLEYM